MLEFKKNVYILIARITKKPLHRRYLTQDAIVAETGQGVFFVVGNQQRAAIHSEPQVSP